MISIQFVAGLESYSTAPRFTSRSGLTHRLAVIQDTCVEGVPDMYLDQALWLTLVDYFRGFDPAGAISIALKEGQVGRSELSLDSYLAEQERIAGDEWEPPCVVLLRSGGQLKLCMVVEAWWQVGGPTPYHDSCTYSVFSDRDLTDALPDFLRAARADQWSIATDTLGVSPDPAPSRLRRLWRRFIG